ncbi:MAG: hypothetical protein HYR88_14430 [Verrucomicrobia bacterium]|nr:hypothetical protein [Verrucomicrobiota bacterium]
MAKPADKPKWQACNVLAHGPLGPRLWQIAVSGDKFALARPTALEAGAALQPKLVAKDWNEVVRPRLNILWLPPSHVFVRVVQLPKAEDFSETLSMIEFQLEKLSPLPVAQILWTFELVPARGLSETQTVLLVVVPRNAVEDHLGKMEKQGYLADRVELPFVDELLAVQIDRDGALLFPVMEGEKTRFFWVAWWYGGVLQSIGQIHLPTDSDPAEVVQAQLSQMAWAGELDGWLHAQPRYYLVADASQVAEWKDRLQARLDFSLEVIPAATEEALAPMTAKRAARSDPRVGLLPAEVVSRYRQEYVDKLWMQSLFGALAFYLFCVLIYLAIVAYKGYDRDTTHDLEVAQGTTYANTLKIRDQVRVLQEQLNLQLAALNCYLAVATNLPSELSLDTLNFDRGVKLTLNGSGSAEAAPRVTDFLAALQKAQFKDQRIFNSVDGPNVTLKPGGAQINWTLIGNIRRTEVE